MSDDDCAITIATNAGNPSAEDAKAHADWVRSGTIQSDYLARTLGDQSVVVKAFRPSPTVASASGPQPCAPRPIR